jgi:DNA-binding MarR family transcriptional regulator
MNSQRPNKSTLTLSASELAHQRASGDGMGDVAIYIQMRTCNAMMQERLARLLEPHEISNVGYYTMMALYGRTENLVNPSELCDITGETRGNMTRICDELVDKGWMLRVPNPEDRRRVDLSLTDTGIALLQRLAPQLRKHADAFYAQVFTKTEKATLQALLTRFAQGLVDY